jgi:WD40 repeat protein/class 3 adenylate cyclase
VTELIRGRYEALEVLGEGGEGRVLKALDRQHGRIVALKVRDLNGVARGQLLDEARVLLAVSPHPNLSLLREDFFDGDTYVLAMDWVEGTDLEQLLRARGRPGLAPSTVIGWLAEVAEAMTHLHTQEQPVVHGDVKPANLVLTRAGHVVLVDFGLSSAPGSRSRSRGTAGFTAPELVAGASPSRASDVYALAATAFALLTGAPPTGIRPQWEGIDPEQGAALESAIRSGLATDPARRPATPGELVEAIRAGWGSTLPTGVLTFCLTDIEGSALAWERDPISMSRALARHDLIVAGAVEARGGRFLKSMGEGDATVSAFTSAEQAVAAALDAQRALGAEGWPDNAPLRVRMALHTGEAEQRDGDYFGATLNVAARVRDLADGNQVFLSAETAALVGAHLPAGGSLVDLGSHRLRGASRPERVFALDASGLDVPRPASDCPYQGLLAFDVGDSDRFFGRASVVADLEARIERSGFVAVVGSSGSGKSSVLRAGLVAALGGGTVITPGAEPPDVPAGDELLVVDQFEELFTLCRDDEIRTRFVDDLLARPGSVAIGMRADFYGRCAFHPGLALAVASHQILLGPMTEAELHEAIEAPAAGYGLRVEPALVELLVLEVGGEPGALPLLSHALLATWEARDGRTLTLEAYRATGGVDAAIANTANAVLESFDRVRRTIARRVLLRLVEPGDGGAVTRRRASRAEFAGAADPDTVNDVLDRLTRARLLSVDEDHVEIAHEALIREWPTLTAWVDEDRSGLRLHRHLTAAAAAWVASRRDAGDLYRGQRLAAAIEWRPAASALSEIESEFLDASTKAFEREQHAQARVNRRLRFLLAGVVVALVVALIAGSVAFVQQRHAATARDHADVARVAAVSRSVIDRQADVGLLLAAAAYRLEANDDTRSTLLSALTTHPLLLGLLHGSQSGLNEAVISRDGRTIATPTAGGTILWDARSHRRLASLGYERDLALGADFSPDGRFLAVGVTSGTTEADVGARLQVWDVRTRRLIHLLPIPGVVNLTTVAWSDDGRTVIAQVGPSITDERPTARVIEWDPSNWRMRGSPWTLSDSYEDAGDHALTVSSDGGRVALPLPGGTVGVWATTTRRPIGAPISPSRVVRRDMGAIAALTLSHDGGLLAVGTEAGPVLMIDPANGKLASPALQLSGDLASTIDISANGALVAVGRHDGRTQLFDRRSGEALGEPLAANASDVNDVTFSDDGTRLVTAGHDRTGAIWSLDGTRALGVPLAGQAGPLTEAAFGRSFLATAGTDGTVALRSATTGRVERLLRLGGEARTVAIDAQTGRVAAGGTGGSVAIWPARGDSPRRISVGKAWVHSVAFRPDGQSLAIAVDRSLGQLELANGPDIGAVRFVDPSTGREAARAIGPPGFSPLSIAWSRDGRKLAVATADNFLHLYDARTHRELRKRIESVDALIGDVTFDPSGTRLVGATVSGVTRQWDVASGKEILPPFEGQVGLTTGVAFNESGQILATTTVGLSETQLWDPETARPIGGSLVSGRIPYTTRTAVIHDFLRARPSFSPDGQHLATVGFDGASTLWDVVPDHWLAAACDVAGRDLTAAEWHESLPGRQRVPVCPDS